MNAFAIVFIVFSIILLLLVITYFTSSKKIKEAITRFLALLSGSVIILNLLLMTLNKYESNNMEKITYVSKIDDKKLQFSNNIHGLFIKKQDNLNQLFNEIYNNQYPEIINKETTTLNYDEINIIFMILQYIENLFRIYYIQGGEKTVVIDQIYEGWDALIENIFASPKVQLFYSKFNIHYQSFGFNKWIENRYIKKNNYFNLKITEITEKEKTIFGIKS